MLKEITIGNGVSFQKHNQEIIIERKWNGYKVTVVTDERKVESSQTMHSLRELNFFLSTYELVATD